MVQRMDSRAIKQYNMFLYVYSNLLAATSKLSVFIGQKIKLTGWENANNIRNAIWVDTQTSVEGRLSFNPERQLKFYSCLHWRLSENCQVTANEILFGIETPFIFMYRSSYFLGDFSTYTFKYVNKTSHFVNNLYFGHNERRFHSRI